MNLKEKLPEGKTARRKYRRRANIAILASAHQSQTLLLRNLVITIVQKRHHSLDAPDHASI
jgi:hypothetical protein